MNLTLPGLPPLSITARITTLLALIVGLFLIHLIPPMQSPDEGAHLLRAYLWSHGKVIMDAPPGKVSGGATDVGLIRYAQGNSQITYHPDIKRTQADQDTANHLAWQDNYAFVGVGGIASYFPAIYTPQAAGLFVGEHLRLSIATSYWLARLFAMLAVIGLVLLAHRIHPLGWPTLVLLAMPMSVFQAAMATQDGIADALTLLCACLFLRGMDKASTYPRWMSVALGLGLFVLASAKPNMLPLLIFPLAIGWRRGSKADYLAFALAMAVTLAWTAIAMKTTVDLRVVRPHSTGYYLTHYLTHPLDFAHKVSTTLTDSTTQRFYLRSFVGILGWLEMPLPTAFYWFTYGVLLSLTACALVGHGGDRPKMAPAIGALAASGAMLLIFLGLLVSWTPEQAALIDGIQGRYFIAPTLLLVQALAPRSGEGRWARLPFGVVCCYVAAAAWVMLPMLAARYQIVPGTTPVLNWNVAQ
ncbi:MAG: DUF2142 domain-containing protein [Burkholderiales bacterium]|nr:DUF2142 domain-containing protein [Burkholderiales bacterium]